MCKNCVNPSPLNEVNPAQIEGSWHLLYSNKAQKTDQVAISIGHNMAFFNLEFVENGRIVERSVYAKTTKPGRFVNFLNGHQELMVLDWEPNKWLVLFRQQCTCCMGVYKDVYILVADDEIAKDEKLMDRLFALIEVKCEISRPEMLPIKNKD